MTGTPRGGLKTAATNKERYGEDFYKKMGQRGGKASKGGAFDKVEGLAERAGRIGGTVSRRDNDRLNHNCQTYELFNRQGIEFKRCKYCGKVKRA